MMKRSRNKRKNRKKRPNRKNNAKKQQAGVCGSPGTYYSGLFFLPQQRHTASQFIDLFLWAADGDAKILQAAFGNLTHLFNKFLVSLAALSEIGKIHHRQVLKFRLVQLLADLLDDFRGAFQDWYGKFKIEDIMGKRRRTQGPCGCIRRLLCLYGRQLLMKQELSSG